MVDLQKKLVCFRESSERSPFRLRYRNLLGTITQRVEKEITARSECRGIMTKLCVLYTT